MKLSTIVLHFCKSGPYQGFVDQSHDIIYRSHWVKPGWTNSEVRWAPPGHLVSSPVRRGPWMSTVVLYCWCLSDSASVLLYFTFKVTINDISVIYVTAHRCAGGLKKMLDLRSGSQRHRHFVGFFNVPVKASTRGQPFYTVISRNRPIKTPFTARWGYGGHILDWTPGSLEGNTPRQNEKHGH